MGRGAFRDLACLLGQVHVDRHPGIHARGGVDQFGEHQRVHGAHRVRRHADAKRGMRKVEVAQLARELDHELRIAAEAPLRGRKRPVSEAAVRVEDGHERERDARVARGRDDAVRHFRAVRVGLAFAVVVDVVEFAHGRIAVLEHLDVQVPRDRLDVLGLEKPHEPVHLLAPGPEVVGGVAAEFRQARHGALERMRVDVGHAGQDRARGRGGGAA